MAKSKVIKIDPAVYEDLRESKKASPVVKKLVLDGEIERVRVIQQVKPTAKEVFVKVLHNNGSVEALHLRPLVVKPENS